MEFQSQPEFYFSRLSISFSLKDDNEEVFMFLLAFFLASALASVDVPREDESEIPVQGTDAKAGGLDAE